MSVRGIMWLLATTVLMLCLPVRAATVADIQVSNGAEQARITFLFMGDPQYRFSQSSPRTVLLDIQQNGVIQGLPLVFSGNNLVHQIRSTSSGDPQTLRLAVDLTEKGTVRASKQPRGAQVAVVFTIDAVKPPPAPPVAVTPVVKPTLSTRPPITASASQSGRNPFHSDEPNVTGVVSTRTPPQPVKSRLPAGGSQVVVAIDAGHGGQDPGAIGAGGTREKNVTLSVARKLRTLLNNDPMFKGVLTRDGDYFISVMGRSEVARKQNANLLVSIHADAAPNREATGASVWVLSNRRADSEMAGWLEQHEKQSELLGGAGDVLANQVDPYLSQAVLDLQFGHSQRVGYDVATYVIRQLNNIGDLHKRHPEHASLGVLRSPDIPSLLVETGFISNSREEQLLASDDYQQKIANAIYQGLRNYFIANPLQASPGGQTNGMISRNSQ